MCALLLNLNIIKPHASPDKLLQLAQKLANGPRSLGLIRKAYWQSLDNSFAEQMQFEANLQQQASATWDNKEGVTAFLEKRKAKFEGR